jgi:hypothetical protein
MALVDSGATENFLNLTYTKWLQLSIKKLENPRKLYNVDGTENKAGELQYYTNLENCTGATSTKLCFFLLDCHQQVMVSVNRLFMESESHPLHVGQIGDKM